MNATLASERPVSSSATERVPLVGTSCLRQLLRSGLAADLATKAWAFSAPDAARRHIFWLWNGHVGVQLSRNWGALFGMGQGKVWLFATLSCVAMLAIPTWLFVFRAARDFWLTFALGCVMARRAGQSIRSPWPVGRSLARAGARSTRCDACGARLDSVASERPVALAELQYCRFAAGRRRGPANAARHVVRREIAKERLRRSIR